MKLIAETAYVQVAEDKVLFVFFSKISQQWEGHRVVFIKRFGRLFLARLLSSVLIWAPAEFPLMAMLQASVALYRFGKSAGAHGVGPFTTVVARGLLINTSGKVTRTGGVVLCIH